MPGRPTSMARRVKRLLEFQAALADELRALVPTQYLSEPPSQPGGRDLRHMLWQSALDGAENASEYLEDLSSHLEFRAEQAERARAGAAPSVLLGEVDDDNADEQDREAPETPPLG